MGVIVKERRPGEWWLYISHHGKRKAKKVGSQKAAEEAAKTDEGKQLLYNCHLVVSRQIPQTRDTKMLYMLKSFQQMFGALSQGGY